ncbi:hypothetical protein LU293_00240 [Moraxella nasovis]|uniref:hypothetical protein n=1 Tax=Moraxella nasovis TaxID=2904121 RepID=UPI001F623EFC|nr:hypothetical protein [Moraxella nasovis]UNU73382.1 hypothetical protein LU293_00240 [Moraxella nasovis]
MNVDQFFKKNKIADDTNDVKDVGILPPYASSMTARFINSYMVYEKGIGQLSNYDDALFLDPQSRLDRSLAIDIERKNKLSNKFGFAGVVGSASGQAKMLGLAVDDVVMLDMARENPTTVLQLFPLTQITDTTYIKEALENLNKSGSPNPVCTLDALKRVGRMESLSKSPLSYVIQEQQRQLKAQQQEMEKEDIPTSLSEYGFTNSEVQKEKNSLTHTPTVNNKLSHER